MGDEKQILWIFTISFPYGTYESFLENELPVIAQGYDRVLIFPFMPEGKIRPLPANTSVVTLIDIEEVSRPLGMVRSLLDIKRLLWAWRTIRRSAPSYTIFRKHQRELLSTLRQALYREHALRAYMQQHFREGDVTFYSYWTSDWATVLALLNYRLPHVNWVSRMHGFDLYAARSVDNWPKFQSLHIAQAKRIYVASLAGLNDLNERYPEFRDKFRLARLGSSDHGIAKWAPSNTLRIVSCSHLFPLKRVHIIAEALGLLDIPISWTHLGGGIELDRISEITARLPANAQVEFKGAITNSEVIEWYLSNEVDMFVHVSSSEGGAPVSLQEAASFGVPLIGADAGGVREIVTSETGILLPHDLSPQRLAQEFMKFKDSKWYNAGTRSSIRDSWSANFDASVVYRNFLQELRN